MFVPKYIYVMLFFLVTSVVTSTFGLSATLRRHKYIAGGFAICAVLGSAYGAYSWWCSARPDLQMQKLIEAEVHTTTEDTIVDLVLLTVKPRSNCSDKDLIRKAQLDQLKKEVIAALPKTPEYNRYRTGTGLLELGIDLAEQVRLTTQNPYENKPLALEWQNLFDFEKTMVVRLVTAVIPASMVRNRIRDEIVNSIILGVKPIELCTDQEKVIMAETVVRRKHIMEKLTAHVAALNETEFKAHFVPTISIGTAAATENEHWFRQLGRGIKNTIAQQTEQRVQSQINGLITKDLVLAAVSKADTLIALFDPVS